MKKIQKEKTAQVKRSKNKTVLTIGKTKIEQTARVIRLSVQ